MCIRGFSAARFARWSLREILVEPLSVIFRTRSPLILAGHYDKVVGLVVSAGPHDRHVLTGTELRVNVRLRSLSKWESRAGLHHSARGV